MSPKQKNQNIDVVPLKQRVLELEDRVREMHGNLNLTSAQVAAFLEVEPGKWSQWKTGYLKKPASQYVARIAELTGFSCDWVAKGTGMKREAMSEVPASYGGQHNDLMGKTWVVLQSNTTYTTALASNIEAFYQSVVQERQVERQKEKIDGLETQLSATNKSVEDLKKMIMEGQAGSQKSGG